MGLAGHLADASAELALFRDRLGALADVTVAKPAAQGTTTNTDHKLAVEIARGQHPELLKALVEKLAPFFAEA